MLDIVVVGLGGVGSFCLRSLARQGVKVSGIEQYRRTHDRGSSHGGSRIYRKAYFEGPMYVPWIQYSEQVFRDLGNNSLHNDHSEQKRPTAVPVIEPCGTLIIEEQGGPLVSACVESALQWNIPTQYFTNAELRHSYPQFKLASNNTVGLLEPGGGFIRPENAMRLALDEAEANGAQILEETIVHKLVELDDYVEVYISQSNSPDEWKMIQAKAVVVSSGSWTSKLIPSWAPYLTVTRQVQAWIHVGDDEAYHPRNFPTWCMSTPHHPITLYGVPIDPLADKDITMPSWIKFGLHGRDVHIRDPSSMSLLVTKEEHEELLEAANVSLACSSPSTSSSCIALAKPCLYTMSRDGHFLLGRPTEFHRVVAAAGLSGHGFKMTPALGEMLCDLVLGNHNNWVQWNADSISPNRFMS